jgi:adenylate cyclase
VSLTIPLDDIAPCLEGIIPSPFSTCSGSGVPNITYLSIVRKIDPDHVGLSFQFFSKTHKNLQQNPRAQVVVVDPGTMQQYRLDLLFERTETSGPVFEKMRTQLDAIASQTGMAKVFVLRGVDVYEVLACEAMHSPGAAVRPEAPSLDTLAAFDALSRRISACRDLDSLFSGVLEELSTTCGYEHSFLLMLDEDGRRLFTIASRGYPASGVGSELELGEGLLGVCAQKRTVMRSTNLARDLAFSRAVRTSLAGGIEAQSLEREIPLPGIKNLFSQLAVPLVAQDELLGVLCLQSECAGRFLEADARLMELVARHLSLSLALLRAEDGGAADTAAARPGAVAVAGLAGAAVKHYASDDSIFIDDHYVIKGVAGRILWKLLRAYVDEGRRDFSNKEIRLDLSLGLPEIKDNLETRLILLRRRLEERCAFLRIRPTGRGRFQLQTTRRLGLEELR